MCGAGARLVLSYGPSLPLPRENEVPSRLTPFSSLTPFVVRESGARRSLGKPSVTA